VTGAKTQPPESHGGSRAAIRTAAVELFAEHGYAQVTVRQIAARAGVSPGLVIKLMGSKADLYSAAGPTQQPLEELDLPQQDLGRALVSRMLERRDRGLPDGYANIAREIHEAPDPDVVRAEFHQLRVQRLATLIGDPTSDLRHASALVSTLIGLATSLRVLNLYGSTPREELIALYAPLVQQAVDAAHLEPRATRRPGRSRT